MNRFGGTSTQAARTLADRVLSEAQDGPTVFGSTTWWRNSAKDLANAVILLVDHGRNVFDKLAADALADQVDALIRDKVIDSRSPAADALLSYREEPRSLRSQLLRASQYRYLVVINREGTYNSAVGFDDLPLAAQYHENAGAQWSDSFLCEVIRGPVV